jgi:hypothetical protein
MIIIVAKSKIPIKKKSFWYHEVVLYNAHAQENKIVQPKKQIKEL